MSLESVVTNLKNVPTATGMRVEKGPAGVGGIALCADLVLQTCGIERSNGISNPVDCVLSSISQAGFAGGLEPICCATNVRKVAEIKFPAVTHQAASRNVSQPQDAHNSADHHPCNQWEIHSTHASTQQKGELASR